MAQKYEKKIELSAPTGGSIRVMKITEAQYKNMLVIENYQEKPEKKLEKNKHKQCFFFLVEKALQNPKNNGSKLLYYIKWGFESRLKH